VRHLDILKQAGLIAWRYRTLWIFGFLLALCGGGGGGGNNFRFSNSSSGGDFGDMPSPTLPEIDPQLITVLVVGVICLILLLAVLGVVVRAVTRTALIRMVNQIVLTERVTAAEGWRLGWSGAAWRLFLVGLIVNIPLAILTVALLLLALSPLLLILTEDTILIIVGVILTVLAVLFVILILIVISAIVTPLLELAWRRTVLGGQGVIASLSETLALVRRHLKDVLIMWLLLFGIGIGWVVVALLVFVVSFFLALIVGGIPALLVYLISESVIGAGVAGIPLALLVIILINAFVTGLFLIFQSAVWTLTYLEIQRRAGESPVPEPPAVPDDSALAPAPL
jgi:hypothetical protein